MIEGPLLATFRYANSFVFILATSANTLSLSPLGPLKNGNRAVDKLLLQPDTKKRRRGVRVALRMLLIGASATIVAVAVQKKLLPYQWGLIVVLAIWWTMQQTTAERLEDSPKSTFGRRR